MNIENLRANHTYIASLLIAAFYIGCGHGQAVGALVADYQDDYQPIAPATGWRYLWNEFGAIGTQTNYDDLGWYAVEGMYTATGGNRFGDPSYAALFLGEASSGPGTGHPGPGTVNGAPFDRYVIAAYTLQGSDPSGTFALKDSFITSSAGGNGHTVLVYTNDSLKLSMNSSAGTSSSFNVALGSLVTGDTIYVAIGPNSDQASDSFYDLDFSVATVPEADPSMLVTLLILGFVLTQWWIRYP